MPSKQFVTLVCPTCQQSFSISAERARPKKDRPGQRFCSRPCASSSYGPHRHGAAKQGVKSPEYTSWQNLRARCNNPGATGFNKYGGRGITVCPAWDTFEQFLADMGPRPAPGDSIDRIDTDGGYWCGRCADCLAAGHPPNCRWATQREQCNNQRKNVFIEYQGRRLTCAEWARETGLTRQIIQHRVFKHGWTVEDALTTPAYEALTIEYQGRRLTVRQWAQEMGIDRRVLHARIKSGWPPEKALTEPVGSCKPRR